MEKIAFDLNSINHKFGRLSTKIKSTNEVFIPEEMQKYILVEDWLKAMSYFHFNDGYFYIDSELIDKLKLEKFIDQEGKESQIDIMTSGQAESTVSNFYRLKILNTITNVFDEIKCLPFKNLHNYLTVDVLIPTI